MTLPSDPNKVEAYLARLKTMNVGRKHSDEMRKKVSESLIGNTRTLGYKHSDETKQKMSESHKNISDETREKISIATRGENNPMYGRTHSKEAREKISIAQKTRVHNPLSDDHKAKIGAAHKGKIVSDETKQKLRDCNIGKTIHEDVRIKIGDSQKGKIVSEEAKQKLRGRKHTDETKQKISEKLTGRIISEDTRKKQGEKSRCRKASEETRKKLSDSRKLEKNSRWMGGISFKPYCIKFNKEFKERVRLFFNYTCVECGITQTFPKLDVHHVNYDKESCCNKSKPLFVSLCRRCHLKTNHNREYWEEHFTDIINEKYNGECYIKHSEDN